METVIALLENDLKSSAAIQLVRDRFEIVAVHFGEKNETIMDLAHILDIKRIYFVDYAGVQDPLQNKLAMLKMAELIADMENAQIIITGEHIPMISSEHLKVAQIVNKEIRKNIIRPIFSLTESEVIRIAQEGDIPHTDFGPSLDLLEGDVNVALGEVRKIFPQLRENLKNSQVVELS